MGVYYDWGFKYIQEACLHATCEPALPDKAVTIRLSLLISGREIIIIVFAYPNSPSASTVSCNVNPLKIPLCVFTWSITTHFLLEDLLSAFSLLSSLFACSSFCVCICNSKQMILFGWSRSSCRPFPNLQHSSLTHRPAAAASGWGVPKSFNTYSMLKCRPAKPASKAHPETLG